MHINKLNYEQSAIDFFAWFSDENMEKRYQEARAHLRSKKSRIGRIYHGRTGVTATTAICRVVGITTSTGSNYYSRE